MKCDYHECEQDASVHMEIVDALGVNAEYYCDEHAEQQRLFADVDVSTEIHVDEPVLELATA